MRDNKMAIMVHNRDRGVWTESYMLDYKTYDRFGMTDSKDRQMEDFGEWASSVSFYESRKADIEALLGCPGRRGRHDHHDERRKIASEALGTGVADVADEPFFCRKALSLAGEVKSA